MFISTQLGTPSLLWEIEESAREKRWLRTFIRVGWGFGNEENVAAVGGLCVGPFQNLFVLNETNYPGRQAVPTNFPF